MNNIIPDIENSMTLGSFEDEQPRDPDEDDLYAANFAQREADRITDGICKELIDIAYQPTGEILDEDDSRYKPSSLFGNQAD